MRQIGLSGVLVLVVVSVGAESSPAIYPTYEGWRANEDGTFTLVFGYHNEAATPVTVPAGPENAFLPGPSDRGQPTTFLPGRQRNVCRMVVDESFAGNLQWAVTREGATQKTTERGGLDPLYQLESIGSSYRAAQEIDTGAAERGVCLNRAPVLRGARELQAISGEPLLLRSLASDDGLPREGRLETLWEKASGPGEALFADPSSASTRVVLSAPGLYELRLSASDGESSRELVVAVTVTDP